jgi:serine/threonine-protein kinase RsbW
MNAVDTMLVELKVPRKPEFVRLARATAWALAAQLDFHLTHAEDIKLAVSEACTNAVEHVPPDQSEVIVVRFLVDPARFTVEVVDHGPGFDVAHAGECQAEDGGLGLIIIRSVMDEVDVVCDAETGTCVRMTKYRTQREP